MADRQAGADGVSALTAYVVCLLLIPAPMVISSFGQVGSPSTVVALGCFIWWAWHHLRTDGQVDSRVPRLVRNLALVHLFVVLMAYTSSAGLALPPAERSPADGALIRTLGLVGIVCLLADGVTSRARLWTLARRIAILWGLLCVLIVIQILTGEVWVDRISLPGLSAPEGLTLIKRGLLTRPSGTSTHPIELSAVMAMSMPLVMAVAVRERRHPFLMRAVAVAMPLVLLLNGSRTAVVCGTIAFGLMLLAWTPRARLAALGATFVALAVLFVTMPGFIGSVRGLFVGVSHDPSVSSRTESYTVVLRYWGQHPWLGRGVGTFLPEYWILDNQYLNLLLGGGIITVISLLALFLASCGYAAEAARTTQDTDDRHLAIALLAGVAAGAVSWSLFDASAFPQASGMLFVLVGLASALLRVVRTET